MHDPVEDAIQECDSSGVDGDSPNNKPEAPKPAKIRRPGTPGVSLRRRNGTSEQPRAYIPRGAPTNAVEEQAGQESQCLSCASTPLQFYRLSMPTSAELDPVVPASRPLPTLPQKSDPFSSTSYRPHPAYPVDDWIMRTPSPVKSIRENSATAPLGKRRDQTRSASSLMKAISSTWKRRGTQRNWG